MTKIEAWFFSLPADQRREFKQKVVTSCGIDVSTFYRYLKNTPPLLTKVLIADASKISLTDLYKSI